MSTRQHSIDIVFDGFLEIDTGDGDIAKAEMKSGVPYFHKKGIDLSDTHHLKSSFGANIQAIPWIINPQTDFGIFKF